VHVTYENPGFEATLHSVLLFQTEGETPYWSQAVSWFYPKTDAQILRTGSDKEKAGHLRAVLAEVYSEQEAGINQKVRAYQRHWDQHEGRIQQALGEAFSLDLAPLFNDLRARVSLNPISPRFLRERAFEVFYLNSERGALGMSLHEIVHFVWFYVWGRLFADDEKEYERPHLKWILSEMVVESILRDPRLSTLNPYFPRENGGCVYDYFLDMRLNGRMALDVIEELYQTNAIEDFMKKSYAYCLINEAQIRAHIDAAERAPKHRA